MITGDKLETAVSVGYASQLLQEHMEVVQIIGPSRQEVVLQLQQILDRWA
jgi:magnesium-transporting ATPase (P-type)